MRRRFNKTSTTEEELVRDKVLDVDASMQGTLSFNDPVNLRINGKFQGKLNTKGNLTIGKNADVTAEIIGEKITIAGRVKGNVKASIELKLVSPALVFGEIETPVLGIAEGAIIEGTIKMNGIKGASGQGSGSTKNTLNVDEVAKYLEIDKELVSEWADNGRLPGIREGSSWRFDKAVVDNWVSNEKIN